MVYEVTLRVEGNEVVARNNQGDWVTRGDKKYAKAGMTALEVTTQYFHAEEVAEATGSLETGIKAKIYSE